MGVPAERGGEGCSATVKRGCVRVPWMQVGLRLPRRPAASLRAELGASVSPVGTGFATSLCLGGPLLPVTWRSVGGAASLNPRWQEPTGSASGCCGCSACCCLSRGILHPCPLPCPLLSWLELDRGFRDGWQGWDRGRGAAFGQARARGFAVVWSKLPFVGHVAGEGVTPRAGAPSPGILVGTGMLHSISPCGSCCHGNCWLK